MSAHSGELALLTSQATISFCNGQNCRLSDNHILKSILRGGVGRMHFARALRNVSVCYLKVNSFNHNMEVRTTKRDFDTDMILPLGEEGT